TREAIRSRKGSGFTLAQSSESEVDVALGVALLDSTTTTICAGRIVMLTSSAGSRRVAVGVTLYVPAARIALTSAVTRTSSLVSRSTNGCGAVMISVTSEGSIRY